MYGPDFKSKHVHVTLADSVARKTVRRWAALQNKIAHGKNCIS